MAGKEPPKKPVRSPFDRYTDRQKSKLSELLQFMPVTLPIAGLSSVPSDASIGDPEFDQSVDAHIDRWLAVHERFMDRLRKVV